MNAAQQIRGNRRVESKSAEAGFDALSKCAVDLTALAEEGKLDPVIGRDNEDVPFCGSDPSTSMRYNVGGGVLPDRFIQLVDGQISLAITEKANDSERLVLYLEWAEENIPKRKEKIRLGRMNFGSGWSKRRSRRSKSKW